MMIHAKEKPTENTLYVMFLSFWPARKEKEQSINAQLVKSTFQPAKDAVKSAEPVYPAFVEDAVMGIGRTLGIVTDTSCAKVVPLKFAHVLLMGSSTALKKMLAFKLHPV